MSIRLFNVLNKISIFWNDENFFNLSNGKLNENLFKMSLKMVIFSFICFSDFTFKSYYFTLRSCIQANWYQNHWNTLLCKMNRPLLYADLLLNNMWDICHLICHATNNVWGYKSCVVWSKSFVAKLPNQHYALSG